MSEYFTINTEEAIAKPVPVEPLPLYDEQFHMLREKMPEFVGTLPNPIMSNLVSRLKVTMKKFGGIGISANQCGVYERVFIIGTDQFQITCINPKVIAQSDTMAKDGEGCLSFPGLTCKIERPEWIEAEFLTDSGELKRMRLEGLTARCFLHELDHMNGVRFIERIGPVSLSMARKKQKKLIKMVTRYN